MHVILADESRAVRTMTRAALQQTRLAGDAVREYETGDQVLSWIHMRPAGAAFVIVDWDLPGLDGTSLLDRLEEAGALDDVSVLFCVNRAQVPLAEAAAARGACGYIVRPFSDDELRARIEAIGAKTPAVRTSPPSDVLRDIVTTVRVQQELPSLLSLPSAVIADLFARMTRVRHAAGATIVWPGQGIPALSFITSGEVEILTADGRETAERRGTGDCFAERAFVCGEPARHTVRARTAVDLIQVPKERLVELARRHAAVRSFLTALLSKPAAPAAESEMSGSLQSLAFADLVQFLHSTRKSGLLVFEGDVRGAIAFDGGDVIDARVRGLSGEEAFFELSTLTSARFEFRTGEGAATRTIEQPTMRLLMASYARSAEVGTCLNALAG